MTATPRSATDALETTLARFGVDRVLRGSGLVRNALRDLLPDHPLTASLLAVAVDYGVPSQLADQTHVVSLPILGPRLATRLSAESGLGAGQARWAVAAWATALGLSDAPLPPWPPTGDETPDLSGVFVAGEAGGGGGTSPATDRVLGGTRLAAEQTPETPSTTAAGEVPATAPLGPSAVRMPTDNGTEGSPAAPATAAADATTLRHSTSADAANDAPTLRGSATLVAAEAETVRDPRAVEPAQREEAASTVRRFGPATSPTERLIEPAGSVPDSIPTAGVPLPSTPAPQQAVPAAPERRQRRRFVPLAIAAALLVGAGVAAADLLGAGSGTTAAGAAPHATGSVAGSGAASQSLAAAPVRVAAGRTVTATRGPIELREGSSIARLGDASRVRVVSDRHLRLLTGRMYINAADGAPVVVDTPGGTTTVADGRLLVQCTGACRFQALGERQTVARGGRTVALAARAMLDGSGTAAVTPADLLRADPWVEANLGLDRTEHRTSPAVSGPSILGHWTIVVHRADLPMAFSRPLDVSVDCRTGDCNFTIGTNQHDDRTPGRLTGTARPADASGARFSITYPAYSARCAYPGDIDGTERLVDTVTVSGSGADRTLDGSRTTVYTPRPGSRCSSGSYTRTITSRLAGRPAKSAPAGFPALADQQQLLFNYVAAAPARCRAATGAPTPGLQTDVICSYPTAEDTHGVSRPAQVELAVYGSTAEVRSAYATALAAAPARGSGSCATSPCETTTAQGTGRMQLSGTSGAVRLVAFDPRKAHLLVIASGGTTFGGTKAWWDEQETNALSDRDISSAPLPRVGL